MKLTVQETDSASITHVLAEGDITIADFADPGKNPLELILGPDWAAKRLLVSMERIGFIDSSAFGWMFDCHRRCLQKGGNIAWFGPTPRVKEMIDLLKMRHLMAIYDTEAEARAALTAPAA